MKRIKEILCVLESGVSSQTALQRAITLVENNHAKLSVVMVAPRMIAGIGMPEGGPISTELQEYIVKTRQQELDSLLQPYREQNSIQSKILIGIPFLEIIREVLGQGHDLVIKTPQVADWLNRFFSSDDMHLLRKCPCPVWLIKAEAPKSFRRILAAVDVDDAYPEKELKIRYALNRQTLDMGISLALSEFAELHIAHVWSAIGESEMRGVFIRTSEKKIHEYVNQVQRDHAKLLDALINDVTRNLGQDALNYLKPRKHLIKGWARKEIPVLAKEIDADLVVMGTVGRTGVPGFIMGNTAETILNQIDSSVLAIKPPGFQTPVTVET